MVKLYRDIYELYIVFFLIMNCAKMKKIIMKMAYIVNHNVYFNNKSNCHGNDRAFSRRISA